MSRAAVPHIRIPTKKPLDCGSPDTPCTPNPMVLGGLQAFEAPGIPSNYAKTDIQLAPQLEYAEDDITPRERPALVTGIQQLEDVLAKIGYDDIGALKMIREKVDVRCKELEAEEAVQRKCSEPHEESLPNVPFVDDCKKMGRPPTKLGDWDVGRELGAGRYGKVFSAKNRSSGRAEAVKVITKKDLVGEDDWLNVRNEHQSLAKLGQHPNFAGLTGALQSEERIYFFITFGKGKELFDFIKLRQQNKKDVPKEAIAQLLCSISTALASIHEQGICHRDVKPENILIHQDYTAILVDFGCACPRFELNNQCAGSMPFIAPEFLLGSASDGAPGDVWSLGVVLLEMLHGLSALSRALGWESTETSTKECGSQLMTRFADPVAGLAYIRSSLSIATQFDGDEQLASMLSADPVQRPVAQTLQEAAWLKQFALKK